MLDFTVPARLISGLDCIHELTDVVRPLGERVVIFSESAFRMNAALTSLVASLERNSCKTVVYPDIDAIKTQDALANLLQKIKVSKPHAIIALGGVRTLSLARLIASLAPGGTSIDRFISGENPSHDAIPIIDLPVSARDPFCASKTLYLSESFLGKGVQVIQNKNPIHASVFDPKIYQGLSAKQAAIFLIDQLVYLSDVLASPLSNTVSETNAQAAASLSIHGLRSIATGSLDMKTCMEACEAGLLSAIAIAAGSAGLGHTISSIVHARHGIPKSIVSTIVLPHLLESFGPTSGARFLPLAQAFGTDASANEPEQAPAHCANALRRIMAKAGLPARLQEFRIGINHVQELASLIADSPLSRNAPYPTPIQTIAELLRKAL